MVVYAFDRHEHSINLKPHGNSTKKKTPFRRTKQSTMRLLKKEAEKNITPCKILQCVENIKGGIINVSSSCELPRDRKQVYNITKKACSNSDSLSEVMFACKETEKSSDKYIRAVEAAAEPMCILCTDQQLADMHQFCTSNCFSEISVDPTFNLGRFYVTPNNVQKFASSK